MISNWTRVIWRNASASSSVSPQFRVHMESPSIRSRHLLEQRSKRVRVLSKLARFFTATSEFPTADVGIEDEDVLERGGSHAQKAKYSHITLLLIFPYLYHTPSIMQNGRAWRGSSAVCGRSCTMVGEE